MQDSITMFAKEVLPAVHAMETPLQEHSLGTPEMLQTQGFAGKAAG